MSPRQLSDEGLALLEADGLLCSVEAYEHLLGALDTAVENARRAGPDKKRRHVDAEALCWAFAAEAVVEFGLCARGVLREWGVLDFIDVGRMTHQLCRFDVLQRAAEDTLERFGALDMGTVVEATMQAHLEHLEMDAHLDYRHARPA